MRGPTLDSTRDLEELGLDYIGYVVLELTMTLFYLTFSTTLLQPSGFSATYCN